MEIILTRAELSSIFSFRNTSNIELGHFQRNVHTLFYDCHKISFKDDDGTLTILKDRNS